MKSLLAAAALALGAASLFAAAAPAAAAAQRDWSRTIVATPDGGFRMGNPRAAVKVVEYVSLTCPHCRTFSEQGAPALVRDHVRSGRLSFEIRPYPLDIVAATAAQLNRCTAPAHAFAFNDEVLATQDDWFARLDALTDAQIAALEAAPPAEMRWLIATATGIDAIAARHGLRAAQARACLADQAGADRLDAIKAAAELIGIRGTPSFTINGTVAPHVHDWTALEPLLRAR